jgi:hypothetical protein
LLTRRAVHTLAGRNSAAHPFVASSVSVYPLLIGNDWRDLMIHSRNCAAALRLRFHLLRPKNNFRVISLNVSSNTNSTSLLALPDRRPCTNNDCSTVAWLVVVSDGRTIPARTVLPRPPNTPSPKASAPGKLRHQSATVLRSPRSSAHANELMMATLKRARLAHNTVTAQDAEIPPGQP